MAQFHTLKIPQLSNKVTETQRLAVTDITIDYSSPSVNNRAVWTDANVIPQKGNPIAWRAGANMNTTITFSTDVFIEDKPLKAGTYGFHIIPDGNNFTLMFAHNYNQWGSYYLDMEKDITLKVNVKGEVSDFCEKLDYEFLNWSDNSVTIGLEWADKRIPFKVSVDLNKTVVESFRHELRGINTYHWQAWNDAAAWCLQHNTNLNEALVWINRSIQGGYNGFAANENLTNLTTKALILKKLNNEIELNSTIQAATKYASNPMEANTLSMLMLQLEQPKKALDFSSDMLNQFPEAWFLKINKGVSYYFLGQKNEALKVLKDVSSMTPIQFKNRLNQIIKEIESGTYKLPKR
jgi:tetratricopeptide (TPR) repeat protein|tara:strand:+ start:704 stop:1753 length:1050 start_codon:yes stop_codon:yes gene_type:complete